MFVRCYETANMPTMICALPKTYICTYGVLPIIRRKMQREKEKGKNKKQRYNTYEAIWGKGGERKATKRLWTNGFGRYLPREKGFFGKACDSRWPRQTASRRRALPSEASRTRANHWGNTGFSPDIPALLPGFIASSLLPIAQQMRSILLRNSIIGPSAFFC